MITIKEVGTGGRGGGEVWLKKSRKKLPIKFLDHW
jgi:hypothetical protein